MLGTGLPEALHSNVIDPPFLAVNWPLEGDVLILGGTVQYKEQKAKTKSLINFQIHTQNLKSV